MNKTNLVVVALATFLSYGCLEGGPSSYEESPDALEADTMARPDTLNPFATDATFTSGVDAGTAPRVDAGASADAQGFVPGTGCSAQRLNQAIGSLNDWAKYHENVDWLNYEPVSLAGYGCTGVGTALYAGAVGGPAGQRNTTYIATTTNNKILRSVDGRVWVEAYSDPALYAASPRPRSAFWSNTLQLFIVGMSAAPDNKRFVTSPDGVTWSIHNGPSNTTTAFAESPIAVVAADASASSFSQSSNGTTWNSRFNPAADKLVVDVAFGNGIFVALNASGNIITAPPAGFPWTDQGVPAGFGAFASGGVSFDGTKFIVTRGVNGGGTVHYSTDGLTWSTAVALTKDADGNSIGLGDTYYHDNALYSVGGSIGMATQTNMFARSVDGGVTWHVQRMSAGFGNGIIRGAGRLITLGAINSLPGLLLGYRTDLAR